ncbi:hypothetical protein V8C44DRAFT_297301 [Trichoderma aethiopicum]
MYANQSVRPRMQMSEWSSKRPQLLTRTHASLSSLFRSLQQQRSEFPPPLPRHSLQASKKRNSRGICHLPDRAGQQSVVHCCCQKYECAMICSV